VCHPFFDDIQAGLRTAFSGERTLTFTNQGLQALGMSPDAANITEFLATAGAGGLASRAGALGEISSTLSPVMSADDATASMRLSIAARLRGMEAAGLNPAKLSPSISMAIDLKTGNPSAIYLNNQFGQIPSDLSPVLNDRLSAALATPYEITRGAGSHSEVFAVNELLNEGSQISDIAVYTQELRISRYIGQVKPPCPQCAVLLNGVTYVR
jgi:hypothetical protein